MNFLINIGNFIPDGPNYNGIVLHNDLTTASMQLISVPFSAPQSTLIGVKYKITVVASDKDLIAIPAGSPLDGKSARTPEVYFCIGLNNNDLGTTELSK